ncbi:uncharacterized protein [Canis lupus baileyi]|uniref:Actin like 11 n=3 Tax=Canis lupus TaxID=9612 RepID=A0A8C0N3S2_CANLF|nr:uncharacterized protein LOC112665803 [Canis lupus dingo]XP_038283642.1 uncharacterized protein LOC476620 [Canis lupus familiaris]XP_038422330.1 uncharacterized protein LOC476620 [Canis lupus familiaris]XP_533824.2 uncharacterized protein LOC476620 [Canis lupus familiaris]|eukprot:XP_533824.2 uncharacterized protein LOC476620 [Canis lupus familiaris]
MEVTKKVGGPDPSGPQGHPSASSQQLGGGHRGSQGPWINSGSVYFRQGLSLSTEAIIDRTCDPASQAHAPEPIHQLHQDPAEVGSQCGREQASQDAPKLPSTSPFPSSIVGTQTHLIVENRTLTLPVDTRSDSTSDSLQHGFCRSRLRVHVAGEGKAPAKVLVGWGKGPCHPDKIAPLGSRKSRWLPYFLSGEDGLAATQGPLLTPAQGQGQGKGPCPPAQAPPTPTQANTPAGDTTPMPAAAEPNTCNSDHLTDTTATTHGLSQELLLRKCGNQWSVLLESSEVVPSCQDKVDFCFQKEPPTPTPTPEESSDHVQELEVAGMQVLPTPPENPEEKPLVCTSRPGSPTPGSGPPGTPKSQRNSQENCSSQTDQQPLNVCNNTCSSVPPSAYQVSCHKQSPVQSPREAAQISPSSAPTCQLQDATEDHVLVFDMATGKTRIGLLCHDPTGSRAVLVGVMPSHSSIYVPENVLSTAPLAMPILSPDNNRSSFWSTSHMLSSPAPSSLSTGSYREVALVPKEGRLNLESQDTPSSETPIRVFTGPVPLGMPLQLGERLLSHVRDPGCSKPDGVKSEPSHTVWMLDAFRMQHTSMIQPKKLRWMNSEQTPELAPEAQKQEVPRSLLQEDRGNHDQKEVLTAHPDSLRGEGAGQASLGGRSLLAEQHPLAGQPSLTSQPPSAEQCPLTRPTHPSGQLLLAEQSPSTRQLPLPGQPPLTGTPLARQLSLTGQPPFSQEPPISKGPISGGPPIIREPSQASTMCQEGEPLGLPAHVGVLQMPLAPEETCVYMSRDKVGGGATESSSTHRLSSWQPGSSPRTQEEQFSLVTFSTSGTGCKVLPVAMVGTEPQGPRFKVTPENIMHSSVVAHLGLLRGACYELVPTTDAPPMQSPVLCRHSLGPYQDMAAVVIDTGTGFTKCGLAREDHVLSVLPSRVQLLQHPAQDEPRYAVPENQEGSYPVLNRGVVSDWDALEVLWQHLFYCRLGVRPEELAVLVADSPISPRTNREKVAEILFERFHVPAMQTVHQALLALYAYGRTTGLVLGSGYGTSYVAPILTGDLAPLDTYRLDVAGVDLTEYLAQLLLAGGYSLPKAGLVNQIKEGCCYVAMNMTAEMARTRTQARVDFVLPDKQVITLGSERFCCPEALFQPSLLGLNQPGLPQLALLSISRLEAKQQEQLLANVVLDGGSTLINGFPERLRQELGPQATVLGSPHRAVAAWLGGSIMASRDSFQSLWLSRREYEEEGPWAIYKYHL